jgi:hypothetical protein
MRSVGVLFVTAVLTLVLGGSAATGQSRTHVVKWSPFTRSGELKQAFHVRRAGRNGDCYLISEIVGDITYRCSAGHGLWDPCWRDGPERTSNVICVPTPWTKTVERIHVPHLLFRAGVDFGPLDDYPMALELADGNRCRLLGGAHDTVPGGQVVDYMCQHDIWLVRNLRRGRVWHIGAYRYDGGYRSLGDATIRRAFLGTLPPPMMREHRLAGKAVEPARLVIRKALGKTRKQLPLDFAQWVRLTLPDAEWARVGLSSLDAPDFDKVYDTVLHLVDGRWIEASAYQPYCQKLPPEVLRQLFVPAYCRTT